MRFTLPEFPKHTSMGSVVQRVEFGLLGSSLNHPQASSLSLRCCFRAPQGPGRDLCSCWFRECRMLNVVGLLNLRGATNLSFMNSSGDGAVSSSTFRTSRFHVSGLNPRRCCWRPLPGLWQHLQLGILAEGLPQQVRFAGELLCRPLATAKMRNEVNLTSNP